jgi:hypothetical protein
MNHRQRTRSDLFMIFASGRSCLDLAYGNRGPDYIVHITDDGVVQRLPLYNYLRDFRLGSRSRVREINEPL